MSALINNSMTNAGLLVLAKGASGKQIRYTKIVLGDGSLEEGQQIQQLNDVISPKVVLDISDISVRTDGTVKITGIFTNRDLNVGFYYREIGLYAEDPDGGEVMYCYGNAGDLAEWIPPTGSASIIEKTIDVVTAIGNATNVTAYIPADAYATKADYQRLKAICDECVEKSTQAVETSDSAVSIAKQAMALVLALNSQVVANRAKIDVMWNALFAEVAGHPWTVTFTTVDDVTISSGVWNEEMARIEC